MNFAEIVLRPRVASFRDAHPRWKIPCALLGLFDVKDLPVAQIMAWLKAMNSLIAQAEAGGAEDRPSFLEALARLYLCCEEVELELSCMAITPLIDVIRNSEIPYVHYANDIECVRGRIQDELHAPRFFAMPRDKVHYYNKTDAFGPEVERKFRRQHAGRDIKEAGNCYATGNNSACVFHLMRVIEAGLETLKKRLKAKPKSPNWDKIIEALQTAIDAKVGKHPKWRKSHRFYCEVLLHLKDIKDAWRNPVMHVIAWHDEGSAGSIYTSTKAFMQKLAKGPNQSL